jgi:hypothetical protein
MSLSKVLLSHVTFSYTRQIHISYLKCHILFESSKTRLQQTDLNDELVILVDKLTRL